MLVKRSHVLLYKEKLNHKRSNKEKKIINAGPNSTLLYFSFLSHQDVLIAVDHPGTVKWSPVGGSTTQASKSIIHWNIRRGLTELDSLQHGPCKKGFVFFFSKKTFMCVLYLKNSLNQISGIVESRAT